MRGVLDKNLFYDRSQQFLKKLRTVKNFVMNLDFGGEMSPAQGSYDPNSLNSLKCISSLKDKPIFSDETLKCIGQSEKSIVQSIMDCLQNQHPQNTLDQCEFLENCLNRMMSDNQHQQLLDTAYAKLN